MAARERTPADAGVLAAGLLAEACRAHSETSLRLEVVRDLALDLGRRLEHLGDQGFAAGSLVEAALACADLATLAACNIQIVPASDRPRAVAAAHLAAGATRALIPLVESEAAALDETSAGNTLKDAQSAGWRADLAVKQLVG